MLVSVQTRALPSAGDAVVARRRTAAQCCGVISSLVLVVLGITSLPAGAQPSAAAPTSVLASPSPPPALKAFANAWDGVTAYSATVTTFEQKGSNVQNMVFDYSFRKPSSVIVRILKGPNTGVTLKWDGGTTMQASRGRGFFAALFKRTISLHDPLVTTIRGSSINELSYGALLAHAEQTPGTLSQSAGETIDDVPTEAFSLIPADPGADAGFTREVMEISSATQLPIRILGYDGTTLVRKVDFADVKPAK